MLNPTIVEQAAQRLAGIVNKTPVMTSRTLNTLTGAQIFLKCENFQRVGAFKFRGAYNAVSQLSDEQKKAGVITHSSGNHAQGLALAAHLLGVKATIVMPHDAPAVKKAATAAYGANIVHCDAADREKVTAELIAQHGYTLIHPYDNDHIIAGQGTSARELFAEVGELDALFVPVGGGGLISGSALAAAGHSPQCAVIGVEPAAGSDANQSWRTGEIVRLTAVPQTIADGLRTRFIGERNLAVMRQYVSDMLTVTDEDILQTMAFLWNRMKLIVEPSGAVALAPLFTGAVDFSGKRVGVILSGGNVDVSAVAGWFQPDTAVTHTTHAAAHPTKTTAADTTSSARPRVLINHTLHPDAQAILAEVADIDQQPDKPIDPLQLNKYQALIVTRDTHLSGSIIEEGFNLRAIGVTSSRLDKIDVSAARAMGIQICHAPGSTAVAIAEHIMSRLLLLATSFGGGRLAGKTLGLIGYGSVSEQVARRARAFDMQILVNQPRLTPELALTDVKAVDLVELLEKSDFVSLHVPFKRETSAIIGHDEFELMKPSAFLINTGHTDLVDDAALLAALENGRIAGAALSEVPGEADPTPEAITLRQHPKVIVSPHVTSIIVDRQREADIAVAQQIADILHTAEASETLSLELVPTELVTPHEHFDPKRVARLIERLQEDGRLVNPPITTHWHGRYIILDGATRFTAMKEMGLPYVIVQVVQPEQAGFELHTWYHAISSERPFASLKAQLEKINGLEMTPITNSELQNALQQPRVLCYLQNNHEEAFLLQHTTGTDRLAVMNELVAAYTEWGEVERTLLTDLPKLLAQFPKMVAIAVFPQFEPSDVFNTASAGHFLPAGLTRFVIPGRILRLNADLERLRRNETLAEKRAWFNQFLEQKLARSRLRYYQEPVILLDE